MVMSPDAAETIALQALGWLIGSEDLRDVFLGSSGLSEMDLKSRASDPELLASVLDFLVMDDAWVIRFCDEIGLPYDKIMQVRAALPGGEQVHWT